VHKGGKKANLECTVGRLAFIPFKVRTQRAMGSPSLFGLLAFPAKKILVLWHLRKEFCRALSDAFLYYNVVLLSRIYLYYSANNLGNW
jgi:hypothetical protein